MFDVTRFPAILSGIGRHFKFFIDLYVKLMDLYLD